MKFKPQLANGLYLLTRETSDTRALLRVVDAALSGGARCVQYRDKSTDEHLRELQARALVAICRAYGVPLIVNDDVLLAQQAGAAGVHLGEHDDSVADARRMLGDDAIIGVSCYNDVSLGKRAVRAGADYVAFGAFFASPTKPDARQAPLSLLRDSASLGVPRVAIGGVNADNAPQLIAAGANMVAVISDIFDAPDPQAAARAIAQHFA